MRSAVAIGALMTVGAAVLWAACIRQTCAINADCKDGQYCIDSTCSPPECEAGSDCDDGETCFNHQCTAKGANCDGPAAPPFCGADMNPNSTTYGQQICVGGETGQVALVFFGTLDCGTCLAIFQTLDGMADDLRDQGHDPLAIFLQKSSFVPSPYEIEETLGTSNHSAFVQDTEDLGIWSEYGASQYDLALVGTDGCIAEYWTYLSLDDLTGDTGDAIHSAWTGAME